MEYQSLREHLQSGRRTYDPVDLWECEDPDPENAPSNNDEVIGALYLLPRWAQVVCALTAAEMALPFWEESDDAQTLLPVPFWKISDLTDEDWQTEEIQLYFAPRRLIETLWKWLNGDAAFKEVMAARRAVNAIANPPRDIPRDLTCPFSWAASIDTSVYRLHAAHAATYTALLIGLLREDFYSRWWCNCKRRLAIMGTKEAELEWWQ